MNWYRVPAIHWITFWNHKDITHRSALFELRIPTAFTTTQSCSITIFLCIYTFFTTWCHMPSTADYSYDRFTFITWYIVEKMNEWYMNPTLVWETFLYIIYPSAISIAPIFFISLAIAFWTFFTRSCLMFATIDKSYEN